jgi:alpha 1,2-mannosyltransferase
MAAHPQYVTPHNSLEMMLGLDGADENYNACHFWSNFEIADLDFWRSDVYMKYFEFLDQKGGFYYEVRDLSFSSLWAGSQTVT